MRFLYPKTKCDVQGTIDVNSIQESIEQGTYGEVDLTKIDPQKVYKFSKKHFLGNVAIDYEFYCDELDLWLYDYMIEEK
ncbi:MAG: hypothetical protein Q7R33_07975 [Nitrosarchaeum sp.]|nr:hypothetical protein [Nitrosarchaeum sp.]